MFLNNCIGCHSGMDPMAQAFAYYDFDETQGRLVYTDGDVQPKYFNNDDDVRAGLRHARRPLGQPLAPGQNALLGWDRTAARSGNGAKSLGEELAGSDAFAHCQVEKVFRTLCFRSPSDGRPQAGRRDDEHLQARRLPA